MALHYHGLFGAEPRRFRSAGGRRRRRHGNASACTTSNDAEIEIAAEGCGGYGLPHEHLVVLWNGPCFILYRSGLKRGLVSGLTGINARPRRSPHKRRWMGGLCRARPPEVADGTNAVGCCLSFLLATSSALAADIESGTRLAQQRCAACHIVTGDPRNDLICGRSAVPGNREKIRLQHRGARFQSGGTARQDEFRAEPTRGQ
jgi:hypothetical protein